MPDHPEHRRPADPSPIRLVLSWVWALAPAWSLGFATAPLMIFAIKRIRHWLHIVLAVVYAIATIVLITYSGYPDNTVQDTVFGWALAVNMLMATGHAMFIRHAFFGFEPTENRSKIQHQQQAAIARSMQNEEARKVARQLAYDDPTRAVELRVGRIDIPDRLFPDGGLIDVNNVPVDVLLIDLPELASYRNALATGQRFGFSSAEDMSVTLGLSPRMLDHTSEKLIFLERYNEQRSDSV